jgi:(p)ppGpp synthase/HD superfamily hydrolase
MTVIPGTSYNQEPDQTPFQQRFENALVLANRLHCQQIRKGSGVPYISHLLAVTSLVLENGGGEDEAIAALLHDSVEDQGGDTTLDLIRREFGDKVANIVASCSDSHTTPKPPWRERKETYLAHLASASTSARLVSAADKVHNARTILNDYRYLGESVWSRFKGGRDGTIWYYHSLVDIFQSVDQNPLVDELARIVSELENLAGKTPQS